MAAYGSPDPKKMKDLADSMEETRRGNAVISARQVQGTAAWKKIKGNKGKADSGDLDTLGVMIKNGNQGDLTDDEYKEADELLNKRGWKGVGSLQSKAAKRYGSKK